MSQKIRGTLPEIPNTAEKVFIKVAREMYTSDDVEIDDNPKVSILDNEEGETRRRAWVQAWVYVELDEDDDAIT